MHLIHPALVHFAVAFLVAGGVLEAAGILKAGERWEAAGGRLVLAGTLVLLPTVVAGFLAQYVVDPGPAARDLALHERAGLVLLGLFCSLAMWKGWFRGSIPSDQKILYALLVLAGVGLTVYTAWLGGHLVYHHGVGVTSG